MARQRQNVKVPSLWRFVESLSIEEVSGRLMPFKLWLAQARTLKAMAGHERFFGLKARQLGFTWLALARLARVHFEDVNKSGPRPGRH